MSVQGAKEFMNEAKLIARLQHINLVRVLGYCVDSEEHLLILEYLENRSLSSYLFDKTQSFKLNGQRRLEIINGIARGLLYLHQDSRYRVLHRDLKGSNILLDEDMIPKISDFGMARLIEGQETEVNSRSLVGTRGYMSPESVMHNKFSVKSDVFSFGVVVIETLTGQRNWTFNSNGETSLFLWVWRNWEAGTLQDIVDPCVVDLLQSPSTFQTEELLRCFQIGLLCVQENAEERPTMGSVVMMLGSEAAIPQPKPFTLSNSSIPKDSYGGDVASFSVNYYTYSVIEAR
ncbi:Serine-threonine/tyrosine-protein kinase [Hirschfeldia incana]|nr:Serine-threonine/tyrosine-protein kinase [Hirschfeldia incana]